MTINIDIHDPTPTVQSLSECLVVTTEIADDGSRLSLFMKPAAARAFGEALMRESFRFEQVQKLKSADVSGGVPMPSLADA